MSKDTQKTFKGFLKKKTPSLEFYDASAMFITQFILQFMLQLIIMIVGYMAIADLYKLEPSTPEGLQEITSKFGAFTASTVGLCLITVINEITMILSPLAYWKVKSFNVFKGIGFDRKVNAGQIAMTLPVAITLLMGFMPLATVFVSLVYKTGYTYTGTDIIVDSFGKLVAFLVFTAIIPAICEEILHRGMIARAGSKISILAGVLLSSVIFAFMHGSPVQLFHQFFVGVVCSLVYFMTGSIWIPILVHFFNNAITLIAGYVNYAVNNSSTLNIPWWAMVIMCVVGIVGLFGCLYAMYAISYKKRVAEDKLANADAIDTQAESQNIDTEAMDTDSEKSTNADEMQVVYAKKKKPIKAFEQKLKYLFKSPKQIAEEKQQEKILNEQLSEYSPEKREVFYSMQDEDKTEIRKKNSRGIIFAIVVVLVIWIINTLGGYIK